MSIFSASLRQDSTRQHDYVNEAYVRIYIYILLNETQMMR